MVEKAIAIEPKEALFHILEGRLLGRAYRGQNALEEYKLGARLNPAYYESHQRLGILWDAMGNRYQTKQALENSVRLLKTAAALRRLGRYALFDGDVEKAKDYLKHAAERGGRKGRAAFAELLRLYLPNNAGAYLDAGLALNDQGELLFVVKNHTPFPSGRYHGRGRRQLRQPAHPLERRFPTEQRDNIQHGRAYDPEAGRQFIYYRGQRAAGAVIHERNLLKL